MLGEQEFVTGRCDLSDEEVVVAINIWLGRAGKVGVHRMPRFVGKPIQIVELILPIEHDKGCCTEGTRTICTTALVGSLIYINPPSREQAVLEDRAIFPTKWRQRV